MFITVGSATVDAFVNTGDKLFHRSRFRSCVKVPFGTKLIVDELNFDIGGGGTNTAVAFSRLGLKTGYVGKIGDDGDGDAIFKMLKTFKYKFQNL